MSTDQQDRDRIYQYRVIENRSWEEIQKEFPNISYNSLRGIASKESAKRARRERGEEPLQQPVHQVEFKQAGATAEALSRSATIKTLEQLLAAAKVNLDDWMVDHWVANSWQQAQKNPDDAQNPIKVTLHQVKAFLVRNREHQARERIKDLRKDMLAFAPSYPAMERPKKNGVGHLLEISIPDLHLGKASWKGETRGTYTMEIAERLFYEAANSLAEAANSFQVDRILIPLGNDLFHTDNLAGTTTRGTQQQPDGSHRDHFRRVRQMVRDVVDGLARKAPVTLMFIPGNHDFESVFYLSEAMSDWYHNCSEVTVINSARSRQYFRYGRNLIGFTHGHNEKHLALPMIMAAEEPLLWSKTTYREFHLGHIHRKQETKFMPMMEEGGVRLRWLPSLCKADAWHYEKGFVKSIRAAEAYLWHPDRGLAATFNWYPEDDD